MARTSINPLARQFSREFFSTIPDTAGIYFMRSERKKILYVGKAKSLRRRLRSYRHLDLARAAENIRRLLPRVRKIEWEVLPNEAAATQRERELIRALVPPYNIADAWTEDYFYIGLRQGRRLELSLTSEESNLDRYQLHGCYPHRRLTKDAYSALLRLIYAVTHQKPRFYFPARLAGRSPVYRYSFARDRIEKWERLLSNFLHGHRSQFLSTLVSALLANLTLPPQIRQGLQRDLETLQKLHHVSRDFRRRFPGDYAHLSHAELRERILKSICKD